MRVYGMSDYVGARPVRLICACNSLREFASLSNNTYNHTRQFAAVTKNDDEVATATQAPGKLFWREDRGGAWSGPHS